MFVLEDQDCCVSRTRISCSPYRLCLLETVGTMCGHECNPCSQYHQDGSQAKEQFQLVEHAEIIVK